MAHYDQIGENGLDQVLARRLTTPGGAVAPSVAPEIFPVVTLENDRPEWGRLKSEAYQGAMVFRVALAANYSMSQIYLPTDARSIAVITRIQLINPNPILIGRLVGISGSLAGWVGYGTFGRDTRNNGSGSACRLEVNANAAEPTDFGVIAQLPSIGDLYDQPIVIGPGGAIGIWVNAVNLSLQYNISWYERPAQPGELV